MQGVIRLTLDFHGFDPRKRFSRGPIVTSQHCVAEKLPKKVDWSTEKNNF